MDKLMTAVLVLQVLQATLSAGTEAWRSRLKTGTMTGLWRGTVPGSTREPGGTTLVWHPTSTAFTTRVTTPHMRMGSIGRPGEGFFIQHQKFQ